VGVAFVFDLADLFKGAWVPLMTLTTKILLLPHLQKAKPAKRHQVKQAAVIRLNT